MYPVEPVSLSAESQAAAEQAEKDSERLWLLKSTWRKTNKKDHTAFIEWVEIQDVRQQREAARPLAPCKTTPSVHVMTEAEDLWVVARCSLDNIRKKDPKREAVLRSVIDYCQRRLGEKR